MYNRIRKTFAINGILSMNCTWNIFMISNVYLPATLYNKETCKWCYYYLATSDRWWYNFCLIWNKQRKESANVCVSTIYFKSNERLKYHKCISFRSCCRLPRLYHLTWTKYCALTFMQNPVNVTLNSHRFWS